MPVAAYTSSSGTPARRTCWTSTSRCSVGREIVAVRAASASPVSGAPSQRNTESFLSIDRMALPSASVKLRPSAIASPTDFMVVVRVSSAAGNFSNANRGTLTTT